MIKSKYLHLIGLFSVIWVFLYDSSCGKNPSNPSGGGFDPNPPGPGPVPDPDPVPPKVEDITLWCRYRTTDYGRYYETAGLDQDGKVITYTRDNNATRYFWECPDPYYPLPFNSVSALNPRNQRMELVFSSPNPKPTPEPPPPCPRFLNDDKTYIFSDLYFMVNDTTPLNLRENFEKQALDSCNNYTPHKGAEFVEYGIRSQLDAHPYFFHKPFFANIPSTIPNTSLPFSRIVVFGDSISDNGYFWDEAGHFILQWPYFMGRFSNGYVWVDHLIRQLNAKQNNNPKVDLYDYAVGGAGSATSGYNYGFSNLDKQVRRYLDDMTHAADAERTWNPGYDKTLYVIFIGTNDYFVLSASTLSDLALYCGFNIDIHHPEEVFYVEPCARSVIYGNTVPLYESVGLKEDIRKLIAQAKPGKEMFFLIPFEPDISSLPYYYLYQLPPPSKDVIAASFFVQAAALAHNKFLKQALAELTTEFPNNKIHFLNLELDKIFDGLINDTSGDYYKIAQDAGLKNKTSACFGGGAMDTTPSFNFCLDPASWMFWDGAHPTMTTHCIIAELALIELYKNFAPSTTYTPDYTKCHNSFVKHPLAPLNPF